MRVLFLFFGLLLIRFYISTFLFNNDFYNAQAWVNSIKEYGYAGFYERDFSPRAQANYPSLITIGYVWCDYLAHFMFGENIDMKVLASFYKLPSLLLETGLLVYLIICGKRLWAFLIAINPAIIYNTLFWGQTEGAIASLLFFSIALLFNNSVILAIIFFVLAMLVKQSALVFLPVLAILLIKKAPLDKIIIGTLLGLLIIWMSFVPFATRDILTYPITFYMQTLGGQSHQHQATVNGFNLWYLLGYNQRDDVLQLGLFTLRQWSQLLTYSLVGYLLYRMARYKKITFDVALTSAGLVSFAVFLFLTRMHERHLFPIFILLLPLALEKRFSLLAYYIVSLISFLNLFWVWHIELRFDRVWYLTETMSYMYALLSIGSFIYFYKEWSLCEKRD